MQLLLLFLNTYISEQILKLISEKIALGELEDASAKINQMGSESKERKTTRPKLRLAEQAEQAGVEGDSGDGMALIRTKLEGHAPIDWC